MRSYHEYRLEDGLAWVLVFINQSIESSHGLRVWSVPLPHASESQRIRALSGAHTARQYDDVVICRLVICAT